MERSTCGCKYYDLQWRKETFDVPNLGISIVTISWVLFFEFSSIYPHFFCMVLHSLDLLLLGLVTVVLFGSLNVACTAFYWIFPPFVFNTFFAFYFFSVLFPFFPDNSTAVVLLQIEPVVSDLSSHSESCYHNTYF